MGGCGVMSVRVGVMDGVEFGLRNRGSPVSQKVTFSLQIGSWICQDYVPMVPDSGENHFS